jgi:hypothetical protein
LVVRRAELAERRGRNFVVVVTARLLLHVVCYDGLRDGHI